MFQVEGMLAHARGTAHLVTDPSRVRTTNSDVPSTWTTPTESMVVTCAQAAPSVVKTETRKV